MNPPPCNSDLVTLKDNSSYMKGPSYIPNIPLFQGGGSFSGFRVEGVIEGLRWFRGFRVFRGLGIQGFMGLGMLRL